MSTRIAIRTVQLAVFLLLAPTYPRAARAASEKVQLRSVTASDGVRIAYDVRGSGDPALIFVHCWACNRYFWKNQVDVFSKDYRVVTIDLAGHGDSGKDLKLWSILALAKDVVAVANDLHLRRIILIGHSMGGPVCLEAARELRGRVSGVVPVDSINDVDARRSVAAATADADQLRKDFKGYFSDLFAIFTTTSDPAIRHWVEQQAMNANPDAAIGLKLDTPNIDPRELFANAGVPIRAINAEPPLSERTNKDANRRVADYDAILVGDSGHFIPLERPEEFDKDLFRRIRVLTNERGAETESR